MMRNHYPCPKLCRKPCRFGPLRADNAVFDEAYDNACDKGMGSLVC